MQSTYITPVNLKNEKVARDWNDFCTTYTTNGEATWDKDPSNKMKVGDYLGFKVGDQVSFFKVKQDLGAPHRNNEEWENTSYNIPIGSIGPEVNKAREAVIIGEFVGRRDYADIARCYKQTWKGPRGTQRLTKYNF